jgi:hypothetical protein
MSASPPGTTNLCAVLYEKNDLRLEQRESTDLQPKKGGKQAQMFICVFS